jgi:predicted transcriptional regulator
MNIGPSGASPRIIPMVAPNYAEQRRTLAKKIGLGTKRRRPAK